MSGFTAAVVTVSDTRAAAASGGSPDESGDLLERLLLEAGAGSVARELVPDERQQIIDVLKDLCHKDVGLVITTGGTGLAARDVTPEATSAVIDREAPGFSEAIRTQSLEITPHAMLSRAVSGVRGRTLILNFPGSPKACGEAFAIVRPALPHALELLAGAGGQCVDE